MTSNSEDVVVLPLETTFFLSKDDQTYGPHTVDEVRTFLETGIILPEHLFWADGMEEWLPIGQLFDLPAHVDELPSQVEEAPGDFALLQVEPDWEIVRTSKDSLSGRFAVATFIAIFLHLGLLVSITLGAPLLFELRPTETAVPPPTEASMDVSLVTVDDPPPPPPPETPPQTEVAETPTPPIDPPPPPALPDMPLPTVTPPPAPVPMNLPEPTTPPPLAEQPLPPPEIPKTVTVHHPIAAPAPSPASPKVVDVSPSDYLDAPPPPYPYEAKRLHQQGTVVLMVTINDTGDPVSVTVEQSSGFSILDKAAQKQVANSYRFKVGNSHVFRVPIAFQLD